MTESGVLPVSTERVVRGFPDTKAPRVALRRIFPRQTSTGPAVQEGGKAPPQSLGIRLYFAINPWFILHKRSYEFP